MNQRSQASRFDKHYPWFPMMRKALRKQMRIILKEQKRFNKSETSKRCVGIEIETSCIKDNGQPLDEVTRDTLVEQHKVRVWQKELGAAQIEIMTEPIDLSIPGGLKELKQAMIEETHVLEKALKNVSARPVRLGSDPIVEIDDRGRTTSDERYRIIPNFHMKNRRPGMQATVGVGDGQIRVDNPTAVVAMSSVQFNLDCHSVFEAIELLNRCLITGPYTVALGANARFLDGKDTRFSDIRGAAWEVSHDIRTHGELLQGVSARSGLPNRLFSSLEDYFRDVHDQPSIINEPARALEIACGLYWRDTRIKFLRLGQNNEQIVVEFRPVSLQPSVIEDYAMMAFAFGHALGSKLTNTALLPIELIHDNRWSAMLDALQGKLWVMQNNKPVQLPATEALRQEIKTAIHGLQSLQATNEDIEELMKIWSLRLNDGCPSHVAFMQIKKLWQKRNTDSLIINRDLLREFIFINFEEKI